MNRRLYGAPSRRALKLLCASALLVPLLAQAQLGYNEEDAKRIKAAEVMGTLGVDLFGEQVNFYTGSTSFRHVDLSIPGNNGLAVQVARSLSIEDPDPDITHNPVGKTFGDWELELPYIGGVFLENVGWAVDTHLPKNRCSSPLTDPAQTQPIIRLAPKGYNGFNPGHYWQGYDVVIPGRGSQSLLMKLDGDPLTPTSGGPWYWTTKDLTQFSCVELSLAAGSGDGYSGEGFFALTPDGTKYWFDQMVVSQAAKIGRMTTPNPITGLSSTIHEKRKEIRLYASRIEDRHGNWVTFKRVGGRLTEIKSNDGRFISISYNSQGKIAWVSDGIRTVSYGYLSSGQLATVTYPDASKWTFQLANVAPQHYSSAPLDPMYGNWDPSSPECGWKRRLADDEKVGTITHPSGAIASFTFRYQRHVRASVPDTHCSYDRVLNPIGMPSSIGQPVEEDWMFQSWTPRTFDVIAIKRKQITGAGLSSLQWDYAYGIPEGVGADYGPHERQTTVSNPDGSKLRLTFGNRYMINDGFLLSEEVLQGSQVLQTKTLSYVADAEAEGFPDRIGIDSRWNGDTLTSERNRPVYQTQITQAGDTFTSLVESFDGQARPVQVRRFNSLGYSRRDTTTYYDHFGKWVLGQIKQTWNDEEDQVLSRTEFDNTTALPIGFYGAGKAASPTGPDIVAPQLLQTVVYGSDGIVASLADGLGQTTTLSNWFRGIPQQIQFADGTRRSATVDLIGRVTSTTNETGSVTRYQYDSGDRIKKVTYPAEPGFTWNARDVDFSQVTSGVAGLSGIHWRQAISQGDYRKYVYFDALWRPVVEEEFDAADLSGIKRFRRFAYHENGQVAFESYPSDSIATANKGTWNEYDALGRLVRTEQDDGSTAVATQYAYLNGLRTRVTSPLGVKTETRFQAFDQPSTDTPVEIIAAVGSPDQQVTTINKNTLGQTLSLARSGNHGGSPISLTRKYAYDAHMRLCMRSEPETRTTVYDYDGAGNVVWYAEGQTTSAQVIDSQNCSAGRSAVPGSAKVMHSYDKRNRVRSVNYPGTAPTTYTYYFQDGQVSRVSNSSADLRYTYNARGMLVSETQTQPGGIATWTIGYTYDANGNLSTLAYPAGLTIDYAPNALGQPTKVEGETATYASEISYFPNGSLKSFKYGNGITRTIELNDRQLPARIHDVKGTREYLDHGMSYDAAGNVTSISDDRSSKPIDTSRNMTYDDLDRLVGVTSPMYGSGGTSYSYDPLDNLRSVKAPGRDTTYCYDAANLLKEIRTGGCGGKIYRSFSYDARGNTTANGRSMYVFDESNRLALAGTEAYSYDGLGRRIKQISPLGAIYSMYNKGGQLLWVRDERISRRRQSIFLQGTLIAERLRPIGTDDETIKFQHTDILGTTVAVTNMATLPTTLNTFEYEPYGRLMYDEHDDTAGYTGHVMDKSSGLVYMQQRYYDPVVGRFLSVDPIGANTISGTNFSRFSYAAQNPLRFTDPDGRYVCDGSESECGSLRKYVKTLKSAHETMESGGMKDRLGAVLGQIGEEGDPGLTFNFGSYDSIAENTSENVIGIDAGKLKDTVTALHGLNVGAKPGAVDAAFGAAVVAHEVSHNLDRYSGDFNPVRFPWNRMIRIITENRAYNLESAVDRALGLTTNLNWDSMHAGMRILAVSEAVNESVESACAGKPTGGGTGC